MKWLYVAWWRRIGWVAEPLVIGEKLPARMRLHQGDGPSTIIVNTEDLVVRGDENLHQIFIRVDEDG